MPKPPRGKRYRCESVTALSKRRRHEAQRTRGGRRRVDPAPDRPIVNVGTVERTVWPFLQVNDARYGRIDQRDVGDLAVRVQRGRVDIPIKDVVEDQNVLIVEIACGDCCRIVRAAVAARQYRENGGLVPGIVAVAVAVECHCLREILVTAGPTRAFEVGPTEVGPGWAGIDLFPGIPTHISDHGQIGDRVETEAVGIADTVVEHLRLVAVWIVELKVRIVGCSLTCDRIYPQQLAGEVVEVLDTDGSGIGKVIGRAVPDRDVQITIGAKMYGADGMRIAIRREIIANVLVLNAGVVRFFVLRSRLYLAGGGGDGGVVDNT